MGSQMSLQGHSLNYENTARLSMVKSGIVESVEMIGSRIPMIDTRGSTFHRG